MVTQKPTHPNQWFLKNDYLFSGLFYKAEDGKLCRMVLDFKHKDFDSSEFEPDLMVIMMNPGGSHPSNVNNIDYIRESDLNKFVPTCPDDTQWKVIEFMSSNKFNHTYKYARVLNLSDVCNPKSKEITQNLVGKFPNFRSQTDGLRKLFPKKIDVLIAWGSKPALWPFINSAIELIKEMKPSKIYGFLNPYKTKRIFYYHPTFSKFENIWNIGIETYKVNDL
jgi:hypothetical protein